MRLPRSGTIALTLLSATTVTAVSLSEFLPRAENLTSACETTYCAQISGCERSDFDNHHCTPSCIAGLVATGDQIRKDCASDEVGNTSLIALFRSSSLLGIRAVCPNNVIQVTTVQPSSSTQQTAQTVERSTTEVPQNILPSSLLYTASVTTTAPSAATTTVVSTSSSIPSALLIDTVTSVSIPPSTASTVTKSSTSITTKSSTTKDSTQTGTSKSDGSGGGSPFDFNGAAMHEGVPRAILGVVFALTLAALRF